MGGNAIRAYVGITPKWVKHIYEKYGIYTVLNHAVARYGVTGGGVFNANTDYSDPQARAVVMAEIDVAKRIKEMDSTRPVAMANGDLQYIDIIAEEVPDLDVFGANVYRGISFNTLFQEVHDKLDRPVMVHRVRRRCVGREEHARGPGRPGQVPDRAVARDLRAVRRERHGGQLDRRPHLPMDRRLVEVRPGVAAGHSGHERLVGERRLPRGLRRGRQQHERGVVSPTTTTPARIPSCGPPPQTPSYGRSRDFVQLSLGHDTTPAARPRWISPTPAPPTDRCRRPPAPP